MDRKITERGLTAVIHDLKHAEDLLRNLAERVEILIEAAELEVKKAKNDGFMEGYNKAAKADVNTD